MLKYERGHYRKKVPSRTPLVIILIVEGIPGVSTHLQSSGLVADENSTFRNLALAVSGPFMA